jgi:hypothetical protein
VFFLIPQTGIEALEILGTKYTLPLLPLMPTHHCSGTQANLSLPLFVDLVFGYLGTRAFESGRDIQRLSFNIINDG